MCFGDMLLAPRIFADFPEVVSAQSTRHGGVSLPPYATLNLGLSTADNPEHVAENRRRFFAALGFAPDQTASSHQVHGAEILHAQVPGRYEGYDALVTQQQGLLINVSVADCVPVLVYDPVHRAVAAIHAGWKGTTQGIVRRTLACMADTFGTRGADCRAYVGVCIDGCDYEVDGDVALHFDEAFRVWDAARSKYLLNLKAANEAQLREVGLLPEHIEISPFSTVAHNRNFFSHRAEKGLTGRMLAAIGIKAFTL